MHSFLSRFVILGVMLEAGDGFCKVEKVIGSDGKPDLLLSVDRYTFISNADHQSKSTNASDYNQWAIGKMFSGCVNYMCSFYNILLNFQRSKLESIGAPAIAKFLCKLQVYKSTADIKSAREMFDKYSKVNKYFLDRCMVKNKQCESWLESLSKKTFRSASGRLTYWLICLFNKF